MSERQVRAEPGWSETSPGTELAAALENTDPAALDEYSLVEAIQAAERQIAHLHAVQARLVQELSLREDYAVCGRCEDAELLNETHEHDRSVTAGREVGAALALSPRRATAHTHLCIQLVEDRRSTYAALQAGDITIAKARIIAEGVRWLDDPWLEAEVEDRLLEHAQSMTEQQLKRRLQRMVMQADPDAVKNRHDEQRAKRRVCPPEPDDEVAGTAGMWINGPAEDLTALYTALDAAARHLRVGGDPRNLDQLRFDLLCNLGWSALATGRLGGCCCAGTAEQAGQGCGSTTAQGCGSSAGQGCGSTTGQGCGTASPAQHGWAAQERSAEPGAFPLARRRGRPARVNVTVSLRTLLGLDDSPAELAGYGPIPGDAARRIAADATLKRLITDPVTGRVLEYGRTTYEPPRELADYVVHRDTRCVFPTCDTPSDVCDIDHGIPFDAGGTTGASNNHPLSRGCHVDKTLHGWTIEHIGSGGYRWRSPAGHTYTVPPEAVGAVRMLAPRRPRRHTVPAGDPPPF